MCIRDRLSVPGLLMQRMTTKEPDDEMIEVGIASVEAVFDWKKWQEENLSLIHIFFQLLQMASACSFVPTERVRSMMVVLSERT